MVFGIIAEIGEIIGSGKGIVQAEEDPSLGSIGVSFELIIVFLKASEIRNGLSS